MSLHKDPQMQLQIPDSHLGVTVDAQQMIGAHLSKMSLSESISLNAILLEISPFPIFIAAMADDRLLMVNKCFCQIVGLQASDLIGHTLGELGIGDPEDHEKIRMLLRKNNGEIKKFHTRVARGSITPANLNMRIKQIQFQGQDSRLTFVWYADAEIEKQYALRDNDTRLQTILNSVNESYYETDLQGRFVFTNDTLATLLGRSKKSLLGTAFQAYTSEEDARRIDQVYKTVLSSKRNIHYVEFGLHRVDGRILDVETSVSLVRGLDGTPSGFYGILRDRTEQKRIENAIRYNEEKYRKILGEMEEGYYEVDLKGRFTYYNDSIRKMHGYDAEEGMGINYRQWTTPVQAAKIGDLFQRMYRSGDPVKYHEYEIIRKDGSVRFAEMSGYPLREGDGTVVGFWGISRDRTERKLAQMALQKSEEQYRLLVDNANDGIYISQEGRIKFHNPKMETITGYTSDDLAKINFEDIVYPEDKENLYTERHRNIVEGHSSGVFSFRIVTKNKQTLWVELSAIAITWEGQAATLNFLRDVTDHKKIEARLLQAQKMEAIGTLAGGIAHDFNNILAAIIGYTELSVGAAVQGSEQVGYLKQVLGASGRAKELVHQILAFARQTDENLKPVMVSLIVKETLKLIRSSIPVTIDIRTNIASNASVMGNPTQIHQIVMNLCANAAQSMEKNGGRLAVDLGEVRISKNHRVGSVSLAPGDYLKLEVADTGTGIAPEIMTSIFNPYFTTKGPGDGTGMGLSVVQGIVEKYGGKITVESEPGQGTLFTVYLPVLKTVEEPPQTSTIQMATANERILFVDDEFVIIDIFSRILKQLGYHVTPLSSSLEALELFRARPEFFDLVITDMNMPGMTGDQLTEEILRIRDDIPVILCTGYSKHMTAELAANIGVAAFVYKPVNKEDLAATVRKVLDETKLRNGSLPSNEDKAE